MSESATLELIARDAEATRRVGAQLARALESASLAPLIIGLTGELGTGKTTLVRGILRAMGVTDLVPSPTFTLLENYSVPPLEISHLDLYRVQSAMEIEALGIRELLEPGRVFLIEWPERAAGALPAADLDIELTLAGLGRRIVIHARSPLGEAVFARLKAAFANREL
jgi:tRNA threonylcarbamoyladenosine biosynthesis protein TsaE